MPEIDRMHVFILAYNRRTADGFMRQHGIRTIGKYISDVYDIRGYNPKFVDVYRLPNWEEHPNSQDIIDALTYRGFEIKDWEVA
jgi:hypothetical protein